MPGKDAAAELVTNIFFSFSTRNVAQVQSMVQTIASLGSGKENDMRKTAVEAQSESCACVFEWSRETPASASGFQPQHALHSWAEPKSMSKNAGVKDAGIAAGMWHEALSRKGSSVGICNGLMEIGTVDY